MKIILFVLAASGFGAVLLRLLRSAFRAMRHGAYTLYAREIAANRARRGDLTGLEEAQGWVEYARKERFQAICWTSLWLVLLVVPLTLLPAPLPVYAAYSGIWLIPSNQSRQDWKVGQGSPPARGAG